MPILPTVPKKVVRRRLGKSVPQQRRAMCHFVPRGLDCLQMLSHGGQQAIAWYGLTINHHRLLALAPITTDAPAQLPTSASALTASWEHQKVTAKQGGSMRRETIFTNLRYPREATDPTLCAASNAGTTRACSPFPLPHGPSRAEHDENRHAPQRPKRARHARGEGAGGRSNFGY